MQKLLDEMLNHDCKHSYYKLEQEIMMLKDVIVAPDPSLDQNNQPQFVPNTLQGTKLLQKLKNQQQKQ